MIGVKDSTGNFSGFSRRVLASAPSPGVNWIRGEDTLDAAARFVGAQALVSGLSNVLAEPFVRMVEAVRSGDREFALQMQGVIDTLHRIVRTTGQGVAAIRLAMSLQGYGTRYLRSRNLSLGAEWGEQIRAQCGSSPGDL